MANCTRSVSSILRPLLRPYSPARVVPATSCSVLPHIRGLHTSPPQCAEAVPAPEKTAESTEPGMGDSLRKKRGFIKRIETMPFQAYQLALEIIREDREQKKKQIAITREKIAALRKTENYNPRGRVALSLKRHLEDLKVKADINMPRVKYNFDNGIINMEKPVYRYLMERKWRGMPRKILMQRLEQMNVVPDFLPVIDPVVDVQFRFQGRDVKPGTILDTRRTEKNPTLKIIPFKPGDMLCTVVVVDGDVPDPKTDSYRYRLHWLVSNIPISLLQTQAIGTGSKPSDTIVPYLPPHCQKGITYHRLGLFVFKQKGPIDAASLQGKIDRDKFNLRSFQATQRLETIGATMWRNEWDEYTKEVMERHNLPGWDIMWQRVKA